MNICYEHQVFVNTSRKRLYTANRGRLKVKCHIPHFVHNEKQNLTSCEFQIFVSVKILIIFKVD